MTQTKSIFQRPLWVAVFALTAAIAWGWAYPLIKLGYSEFAITADMTGSKMLFAGIRFCLSGLIILAIASAKKRNFKVRKPMDWWYILLFCMMNTTLHYAFFYFGLSHSEGSRAAILNSLSVFSVVIFACILLQERQHDNEENHWMYCRVCRYPVAELRWNREWTVHLDG